MKPAIKIALFKSLWPKQVMLLINIELQRSPSVVKNVSKHLYILQYTNSRLKTLNYLKRIAFKISICISRMNVFCGFATYISSYTTDYGG
jgi:hypothetical protein